MSPVLTGLVQAAACGQPLRESKDQMHGMQPVLIYCSILASWYTTSCRWRQTAR